MVSVKRLLDLNSLMPLLAASTDLSENPNYSNVFLECVLKMMSLFIFC